MIFEPSPKKQLPTQPVLKLYLFSLGVRAKVSRNKLAGACAQTQWIFFFGGGDHPLDKTLV